MDAGNNAIGRFVGGHLTEFPIPTPNSNPFAIVEASGGVAWFTEADANQIGRISANGAIAEFPLPTALGAPIGIAVGPNGDVWFTEATGDKIGKVAADGHITEFPLPTPFSYPVSIAVGSNGVVWFTEVQGEKIGQLSASGSIVELPLPAGSQPEDIVAGPITLCGLQNPLTAKSVESMRMVTSRSSLFRRLAVAQ